MSANIMPEDAITASEIPDQDRASPIFQSSALEDKKPAYNYHKLAELIGSQPGLAVFRRFATLNAKNLLYLQAEIAELEDELELLELSDWNSQKTKSFQWEARLLMEEKHGRRNKQWNKMLEIRVKLKEYNEILFQHQQLYRLPQPNNHDISKLREWLERADYGDLFLERPEDVWRSQDPYEDLVALSARATEGDRFSSWLTDRFFPFIHRQVLHRPSKRKSSSPDMESIPDQTFVYSDKRLNRSAEIISTMVSSLLPMAGIFALYYIHSQIWRLAFLTLFSALFTASLAIFTSARRIEIFAAAVGMASVQVVFIGTNSNGPNN